MKKISIKDLRQIKFNLAPVWGANSIWEKEGIIIVDELGNEEQFKEIQSLKDWLNKF